MLHKIKVIGVMSGTSLDGLDLCYVEFIKSDKGYAHNFIVGETKAYSDSWIKKLNNAFHLEKTDLAQLDLAYGKFIGDSVNLFIDKNDLRGKVDLIGSHGHTVFHQPHNGITVQIGDGDVIKNLTGINVIHNFRIKDVELGGQGAPLVPIGDELLFGEYEACLNLGGFANISFEKINSRIAFDIAPANLPLNQLMISETAFQYDKNGELAKSGEIIDLLLNELDTLNYYQASYPKSLGVEWLNSQFYPIIERFKETSLEDRLRTIVEHETNQIAQVFNQNQLGSVLISGGGAHNGFFIDCLKKKSRVDIIIPTDEIIEYKEALIFAFLATLNFNNQVNTLSSVTGASKDSIGGVRCFLK